MKAVTSIDPSILSIHCKSDMILLLQTSSLIIVTNNLKKMYVLTRVSRYTRLSISNCL